MKKAIIGVLIAFVIGIFGFSGYAYYEKVQNSKIIVLTVSAEIPPRTLITQEMFDKGIIKENERLASEVPPNVYHSKKEVIGKYTTTNYTVPKNSYLYQGKLLTAQEMADGAALLLKKGEKMIAIDVTMRSSLAAQIVEGDYINPWLAAEDENRMPVVGPFLESVRVIGTYATNQQKSQSTAEFVPEQEQQQSTTNAQVYNNPSQKINLVPQTILLAVNDEQAGFIQLAEKKGEINIVGIGKGGEAPTGNMKGLWSVEHMQAWLKSQLSPTFATKSTDTANTEGGAKQ